MKRGMHDGSIPHASTENCWSAHSRYRATVNYAHLADKHRLAAEKIGGIAAEAMAWAREH